MADKKKLIEGLNNDLANELGAVILYLYQTSTASGWEGEELREFLTPEISGELQHAIFLAEKIAALGGTPTTMPTQYKSPRDVKQMMEFDLRLEKEAIETYQARARQAEETGEYGLKLKLEELIVDETGHAEQLQRILKGT